MNIEYKERDLNPPDFEPVQTFDDLTSDEQNEILDAVFLSSELGDVMADMHDNETLHAVISAVHKAWQERNGLKGDDFSFIENMAEILLAYDKALKYTLAKEVDEEIKHIQECRLCPFNDEE